VTRLTNSKSVVAGAGATPASDIAWNKYLSMLLAVCCRVSVRLPPGAEGAALEQALRAQLPPDVTLAATRARAQETFAMTDAFTTNLRAMSLLALLVGTFLIYGAVSFAVLQRRAIIGVLRALGATRAEVLSVILGEAAVLGAIGAALGTLLGLLIGRGLVALVSRTINDLYFVVAVNELALPAATVAKALLAAWARRSWPHCCRRSRWPRAPAAGLARPVLEARAQPRALRGPRGTAGGALGRRGGVVRHSLFAGFVALFLLLLAVAAVTPAALATLARLWRACSVHAARSRAWRSRTWPPP
jgi:putative ABC transport system permease protein